MLSPDIGRSSGPKPIDWMGSTSQVLQSQALCLALGRVLKDVFLDYASSCLQELSYLPAQGQHIIWTQLIEFETHAVLSSDSRRPRILFSAPDKDLSLEQGCVGLPPTVDRSDRFPSPEWSFRKRIRRLFLYLRHFGRMALG